MAVAQEGNISRAAHLLHVTQPTLSRQLKDLEEELGCHLFIRKSHCIGLTAEGRLLRRRAEDILRLVERTRSEFCSPSQMLGGDVAIGAGESYAFRWLARAACELRRRHPHVVFHIYSGNKEDVAERLEKGVLDFGLFIQPADVSRYESLALPEKDTWGVLMRKDCPLAAQKEVTRKDLEGLPLLLSRQVMAYAGADNALLDWFGGNADALHLAATSNLLYNVSLMVSEGVGYAIALDRLANCSAESPLCFRPLSPALSAGVDVVWAKGRPLSAAAKVFLQLLRNMVAQNGTSSHSPC